MPEAIELLSREPQSLFAAAGKTRRQVFGDKIYMYGFVYFSTWCGNDCNFCYYRKSNSIPRYRKSPEEVVRLAIGLAESGVHLIDLTMGETTDTDYLELAEAIKKATGLPLMLSPGLADNSAISRMSEIGVDWYALYQETHNRELFSRLRILQDYDRRMSAKAYARHKGILIEEGILTGVGESCDDIADSITKMSEMGASQMRVMTFVPQEGSPMARTPPPSRLRELKTIAAMRLMYPNALIPASLDVDGIDGLKQRIDAGANVVTSIIPPGLTGVARGDMTGRTVAQASETLKSMGLEPATAADYADYLKELRKW